MLNCAVLMGRLIADPELRTTTNGVSVSSFRIAVDRAYQKQGEERQTDFVDIVAWRQTAEFVSRYFKKGSMIAVQGSIQTRNYEDKQGNKRTAVEVVADNVSFCGSKSENSAPQASYPPVANNVTKPAAATFEAVEDDDDDDDDDDDLPF